MMYDRAILFDNSSCRMTLKAQGNDVVLSISGVINEDVNFGKILTDMLPYTEDSSTILIDVSEVLRINSCGVREWMLFMERLQAKRKIVFSKLNETFIHQSSVVPGVLGTKGTPVLTFETPYRCNYCDLRVVLFASPEKLRADGSAVAVPAVHCQNCKTAMELDAIPGEYFEFLKRAG